MKKENTLPKVELNHLIVLAKEKYKTANFLTGLLDLPEAVPADGPVPDFFLCIQLSNDVMILIIEAKEHPVGHYAFKVTAEGFEKVIHKLKAWNVDYWADPRMQRKSEIYEDEGKRGLYFIDPSGHGMEILTDIH